MNAIFLLVTMRSWLLGLLVSARVRASAFARLAAVCVIRHTNAPGLSIVPCDVLGTNARRRNTTRPISPRFSGAVCPPTSSSRPLLALILGPAAGALVAARLPVVIQFGVHSAASAATALCIMLATASVGLDVPPRRSCPRRSLRPRSPTAQSRRAARPGRAAARNLDCGSSGKEVPRGAGGGGGAGGTRAGAGGLGGVGQQGMDLRADAAEVSEMR
jgi:hypothetical protein